MKPKKLAEFAANMDMAKKRLANSWALREQYAGEVAEMLAAIWSVKVYLTRFSKSELARISSAADAHLAEQCRDADNHIAVFIKLHNQVQQDVQNYIAAIEALKAAEKKMKIIIRESGKQVLKVEIRGEKLIIGGHTQDVCLRKINLWMKNIDATKLEQAFSEWCATRILVEAARLVHLARQPSGRTRL